MSVPAIDQRQVALAVVLDEPVADVRVIPASIGADLSSCIPSASPRASTCGRKLMTKVALRGSRAAAAKDLAAEDQRRAHLRHRAQFFGDRARDAVGVVEPRARRQLDREQHAAEVVGGNEARGQQPRRP